MLLVMPLRLGSASTDNDLNAISASRGVGNGMHKSLKTKHGHKLR